MFYLDTSPSTANQRQKNDAARLPSVPMPMGDGVAMAMGSIGKKQKSHMHFIKNNIIISNIF